MMTEARQNVVLVDWWTTAGLHSGNHHYYQINEICTNTHMKNAAAAATTHSIIIRVANFLADSTIGISE